MTLNVLPPPQPISDEVRRAALLSLILAGGAIAAYAVVTAVTAQGERRLLVGDDLPSAVQSMLRQAADSMRRQVQGLIDGLDPRT
jgi:hypothetical protein